MNRLLGAFGLIPALALVTSPARADVVPPLPDECPPGSSVDYYCGAAFCRAFVCETDADCKGGDCEPVKACFGEVEGIVPPPTEHGGPCLRDDKCSDEELTCQTLKLCLSFGGGTSGDGTTAGASTGVATTGTTSTGTTATGGSSGTSTGTTAAAPTSGEPSTGTGKGTDGATGDGSSETSGGSKHGSGCSCSLAGSPSGALGVFGFAALRRRRRRK